MSKAADLWNALKNVCLVQDLEDVGDEATYSNTTHNEPDTSYLVLKGDTLYHITGKRIRVAKIAGWNTLSFKKEDNA